MEKESEHKRDSFIFYRSFYEAIHELKDDIKLEVFTAITEYALYGKVPEDLKPVAKGMFTLIKPNLDVNTARYENGKKGGRKPKKIAGLPVVETSVAAPSSPPAYSSFEDEVAQIKTDQIWCEPVCMQFRIDMSELDKRLDAFVMHCKVERENELHPSIKDAKRHFTSWMRKAYTITERKSNEQPKSDDYTYNGGFGGLD
ncbi:hypothetical protein EEL33_01130 [Muribaculaceae bacterium Isolate-037 (Harlan)]|nr:hypothetical protein EEL33_01130 [Muribaculaceae bacterium Isolate-037 (Harlan)]